ncbi:hypothetical protein [Luteolibacter luteus]|uniref:Uncharacterized protein n=1 Tax=Luteolibacter luteus TaxID=2728835 RepID=A0A858RGU4_9BACT|nr:hypothetical protein [Luteolibacter luteus]QJE96077.1 hypothetical protein HHL09_09870 [Luteolibacter luteus]
MDPADIFGETIWHWIRRVLIFVSGLVLGGSLGEMIHAASGSSFSPDDVLDGLLEGPEWILGSLLSSIGPLVIGLLCVFVISSWSGYWWWFATVALVSAHVIFDEEEILAWGIWVLLLAMLAAGIRTWQMWKRNKWAQELAVLQSENSVMLAELVSAEADDDD